MKFYDCHTHLNYEPLDKNADYIATTCNQQNISLNNIGTDLQTSAKAIALAKKHINVYATVGVHPNDVNKQTIDNFIRQMNEWLQNKQDNKIVALGETGLDYHYPGYDKQKQHKFLLQHLQLAKANNLPLMLHVRDAHEDMIVFLKTHKTPSLKVIIHCFTENEMIAKQYVELGCYLSIPGVITFKKAHELKKALHVIPTNKILSETDAPWLTPEPYRGKNNTPEYVSLIVKAIGEELQIDYTTMSEIIFNNSKLLF